MRLDARVSSSISAAENPAGTGLMVGAALAGDEEVGVRELASESRQRERPPSRTRIDWLRTGSARKHCDVDAPGIEALDEAPGELRDSHPNRGVRLIARRARRARQQVLAPAPLASFEASSCNIVEVPQRIGEREWARGDPVIGDDEIPCCREVTKACRILVFRFAELVHVDGMGASDPIAGARQFDGRSAVKQQVDLDVLVGIPEASRRLECFDGVANRMVVDPVEQQGASSHLEPFY